jgi:hypothetical protein
MLQHHHFRMLLSRTVSIYVDGQMLNQHLEDR